MPGLNEYYYDGQELVVSDQMKQDFKQDGFIIVRNLLSQQELAIVEEAVNGPESLTSFAYGHDDGEGRLAKMCLWNNPGNDTTGVLSRTRKLANTSKELLGADVYHYHSKLMMKEAKTGGKFVWHQDYGYWYNFACLYPDMLTVFIAMDKTDQENGCLQILRGSHRCGRLDHGVVAGQNGADLKRVAALEAVLDTVFVELNAGDALFFHSNLLHTSSANVSQRRRWAILSCYNTTHNSPHEKIIHAHYEEPLRLLDNDAVLKTGVNRDLNGKDIVVKTDGNYVHYFS
ncbi:L-proline trans-4-hydroxylase-like isoform X2 [Biomphalaria glabrata]|nr:L-proline trans-4-hydroxylase-like isoform X2 [Biomphalaria glabrata]XP_055900825.1 L-proline trans-4-hydroxylase-like isoform X2 [Biomphalaria glabrata]